MQIIWSENEVIKLKEIYEHTKNKDISFLMNRSLKSISKKANSLGLKKSKSHKSKMISQRNKIINRDLNYEKLKEIASIYKSRAEFQIYDSSAYQTARKSNLLDDICSHMIKQSFSIPQLVLNNILSKLLNNNGLYNTRKIIKPYELDVYFHEYKLAFEYNGKGWRLNDKINKKDICIKKGIKLFTLVENSRKYEEDIKNQLISILDELNFVVNKKIVASDINNIVVSTSIYKNILDVENVEKICKDYNDYNLFRKENINLYNKLLKLGNLYKYTNHMKKRIYWNETKAIEVINKFEYLNNLIKENYGCYLWIKKNKKEYLLEGLKLKQNKKLKYNNI